MPNLHQNHTVVSMTLCHKYDFLLLSGCSESRWLPHFDHGILFTDESHTSQPDSGTKQFWISIFSTLPPGCSLWWTCSLIWPLLFNPILKLIPLNKILISVDFKLFTCNAALLCFEWIQHGCLLFHTLVIYHPIVMSFHKYTAPLVYTHIQQHKNM